MAEDFNSPNLAEPGKAVARPTIKGSARAHALCKSLAEYYGTSQYEVVEAAFTLLHDRVEGIDSIQIPELMSTLADLQESVGQLVTQADHLERLAFELAALEADRNSSP